MEKFEYLIANNVSPKMLNDLGSVGWELVEIKDNIYDGLVFYFKRKIETKPEPTQPELYDNLIISFPYNEELFIEKWYSRNPCHDYDDNGNDRFYKTAFMVMQDYIKELNNDIIEIKPEPTQKEMNIQELYNNYHEELLCLKSTDDLKNFIKEKNIILK